MLLGGQCRAGKCPLVEVKSMYFTVLSGQKVEAPKEMSGYTACMCVYVYMCVYIYTYVYVYMCVYVCIKRDIVQH